MPERRSLTPTEGGRSDSSNVDRTSVLNDGVDSVAAVPSDRNDASNAASVGALNVNMLLSMLMRQQGGSAN